MGQTFTVGGSNVSSFTLQDTSVTPPRQIVVVVDKSVTGTTTISTTGYSTSNAGDKRQVNRTTALSYSTLSEQCDDVEVILALDTSSSILIADRGKLETAALSFVNGLSPSQGGAHVGVVSFNREASLVLPLNYNTTLFPSAIHNAIIFPYWGLTAGTNMPGALRHATIELNGNSRPTSGRFIVVITDGATNRCSYLSGADYFCPGGILPPDRDEGQNRAYSANQARDYATLAKGDGTDPDDIKIIAVGVGISSTIRHPDGRPYDQYLRDDIASDQQYFSVDGFGDLEEALEQLNCAYFTVRKGTPLYREN
jgi:hypothetical protein